MARICDRSPCDPLLGALGVWVFGSPEGFYIVASAALVPTEHPVEDATPAAAEVSVDYCPFCGTRLEEVGAVALEKYLRPRKRRRATKVGAA